MKTLKIRCLPFLTFLLMISFTFAQDKAPNMFVVHTDNVKFGMMQEYEAAAKELKELMEKHQIKDGHYTAISVEDGRYVYVSPISSMADLDKNPMSELYEKVGAEKINAMFSKMDECYDSHHDNIVYRIDELSYMPEGYSTAGKNFREYHFLYYSPRHSKAMNEAMAGVKKMFASSNIKNGYEVYHSGFGDDESYYMVAVSGDDALSIAQGGKSNNEIMGDAGQAALYEVIKLASRYDQVNANIRPDLSYLPSSN